MQGNQGPIGLQGITGSGAQGNQGPIGIQGNQGNQGPTGIQGTNGNDGAGFSVIYNQILYVDLNGNDATAVLGDPTNPWATIEAAFDYCITNTITRYEIYVNPGVHNLNVGNRAIDIIGTVSLNLSPNVKIIAQADSGVSIFTAKSGCDFKITGGGRAHSQIYVGARGLIQGEDGSETLISLESIYVYVDSSDTGYDGTVVEVVNAGLKIDNCYLEQSALTPVEATGATASVIKLIIGTVQCKSSTLKLSDFGGDMTDSLPTVGSGYAPLYSWVIKETSNGSQLHRIMLHQTAMIVESGGGFILTNPGMATNNRSLLLDSVYMHSSTGLHATLWMDQTGSTDTYYVGSNCVSGGKAPMGNWLQLPPDSMVPNIITFEIPTIMPY
jgi:hypothetical protein